MSRLAWPLPHTTRFVAAVLLTGSAGYAAAQTPPVETRAYDTPAHVAFVDGKHQFDVVSREGDLLAARQQAGDLAIFDDLQVPGVSQAVRALARHYHFVTMAVLPNRAYAVGTRR